MTMSTNKAFNQAAGKAHAGWKGFVWYFKSLMGENAYQAYLDHHARTHRRSSSRKRSGVGHGWIDKRSVYPVDQLVYCDRGASCDAT